MVNFQGQKLWLIMILPVFHPGPGRSKLLQLEEWMNKWSILISSVQLLSCVRLFATLDYSTPGLPVHHQLPAFTQTHVHWVSEIIQPSHPLSSPSPPAFNLSQHQGLFKWLSMTFKWPSTSHQVVKVLEFQLQHQSFQWTFRTDFL